MKISVKEDYSILLEDVFLGVTLKTEFGEEFFICMRDDGFEFVFNGKKYFTHSGSIKILI